MKDEIKGEDGKVIAPVIEKKDEKPAPSQNPIKAELERVGKIPKSKSAQIRFNIQRMQKDLEEQETLERGGEPAPDDENKDKPVTIGMLADIEKQKAQASAIQMAGGIADEDERALTVHYLQTRIVPSGNPTEDFRLAQSLVNSLKNQQVAEEIARKGNTGKTTIVGNGGGAPPKPPEDEFVPTDAERGMMRAPFNLTKDEVIKARRTAAELGQ